MVATAKSRGFTQCLVEYGEDNDAPGFLAAGVAHGVAVGLWDPDPTAARALDAHRWKANGSRMWCAQGETLDQCRGAMAGFDAIRQVDPDYPLLFVTNNIGFSAEAGAIKGELAANLKRNGVVVLVEVEAQLNPDWHDKPVEFERALVDAVRRVLPEAIVVVVLYVGGETWPKHLADYAPEDLLGFYVWDAESCPEVAGA